MDVVGDDRFAGGEGLEVGGIVSCLDLHTGAVAILTALVEAMQRIAVRASV